MSDIRELRLSIAQKLKERRQYMDEASSQRERADRSEREHRATREVIKSNVFSYEIENCADEIIKAVLDKAIEASEIIAGESVDGQHFEIGISIPSFHIRRHMYKMDTQDFSPARYDSCADEIRVKRIDVDLHNRGFRS